MGWSLFHLPGGGTRFETNWTPFGAEPDPWKVFNDLVQVRFQAHLDAAYQGKQLLIEPNPGSTSPYDPAVGGMRTPICNLSQGETTTNHLGQSCGASNCKFEGVCAVCGDPQCPYFLRGEREVDTRDTPESCERERAWKRGAFIQEVLVAKSQMDEQLAKEKAIWFGPKCDAVLFSGSFTDQSWNLIFKWRNDAKNQFDNCNLDDLKNENGAPVQAPCYLMSASAAIRGALAEAMVCEIFARAELRWLNRDARVFEDAAAVFRAGVKTTCEAQTKSNRSKLPACVNSAFSAGIQGVLLGAAPSAATHAWPPAQDPQYYPPRPLPKPVEGITTCPDRGKDCGKCAGDVVGCPDTGQVFLNAELEAMLQAHSFLDTAASNITAAEAYQSIAPAFSPGPLAQAGAGPLNGGNSWGWLNGNGTGPGPSPSPSPSASGDPSDPNLAGIGGTGLVNTVTFPGTGHNRTSGTQPGPAPTPLPQEGASSTGYVTPVVTFPGPKTKP